MNRPDEDMVGETHEGHRARDTRGDSGILWLAQQCRSNNIRIESLVRQAERACDPELAAFFRRASALSQQFA